MVSFPPQGLNTGTGEFERVELGDDQALAFGADTDYELSYDSANDRLEFVDSAGNTLMAVTDSDVKVL